MAEYPKLVLTDKALEMIAESQLVAGPLTITKAKIGDGEVLGSIQEMTDLISPKMVVPLSSYSRLEGTGQVNVSFAVSNESLNNGFFAKEIGIFAKLGEGEEVLYAYTNAGNRCDWIPDKRTPIDSQIIEARLVIGNAPNVVVEISDKAYALASDLTAHNEDINAHANLLSKVDTIPAGMIIPFAGNNDVPVGFLLCNGASVGRATYPDLFEVIGTTYGAVDDEHFNLPNLEGRFIEGNSIAGNYKEAGLPNITGTVVTVIRSANTATSYNEGAFAYKENISGSTLASSASAGYTIKNSFDASRANPIYGNSDTVQPPSMTVRYIIKAFRGAGAGTTDLEITQLANELTNYTSTTTGISDYVVDSYKDEEGNWYRKYKSGWLEQGGNKEETAGTITFIKPFENICFGAVGSVTDIDNYAIEVCSFGNYTTTTVEYKKGQNGQTSTKMMSWRAWGY